MNQTCPDPRLKLYWGGTDLSVAILYFLRIELLKYFTFQFEEWNFTKSITIFLLCLKLYLSFGISHVTTTRAYLDLNYNRHKIRHWSLVWLASLLPLIDTSKSIKFYVDTLHISILIRSESKNSETLLYFWFCDSKQWKGL